MRVLWKGACSCCGLRYWDGPASLCLCQSQFSCWLCRYHSNVYSTLCTQKIAVIKMSTNACTWVRITPFSSSPSLVNNEGVEKKPNMEIFGPLSSGSSMMAWAADVSTSKMAERPPNHRHWPFKAVGQCQKKNLFKARMPPPPPPTLCPSANSDIPLGQDIVPSMSMKYIYVSFSLISSPLMMTQSQEVAGCAWDSEQMRYSYQGVRCFHTCCIQPCCLWCGSWFVGILWLSVSEALPGHTHCPLAFLGWWLVIAGWFLLRKTWEGGKNIPDLGG